MDVAELRLPLASPSRWRGTGRAWPAEKSSLAGPQESDDHLSYTIDYILQIKDL